MSNIIHPTSIVDKKVVLGSNNYIGPFCYITGNTVIGDNNHFEAYCSIGTPAEHRDYFKNNNGETIIGNGNIFREFTTVNSGIEKTHIYDNVTMLRNSHVGHDSIIENFVNLSCNVLVGGHSHLMKGCNFGLGSICHQFSVIGAFSMIGMGGIVTKNSSVLPGNVYVGSPVKFLKINNLGLERNGIEGIELEKLTKEYNILCQR